MLSSVLLVMLVCVSLFLIGIILLQPSEGGGLGMSGGGMGNFMNPRSAGNVLSRVTGILAFIFMGTTLLLAGIGQMNVEADVTNEELIRSLENSNGSEIDVPSLVAPPVDDSELNLDDLDLEGLVPDTEDLVPEADIEEEAGVGVDMIEPVIDSIENDMGDMGVEIPYGDDVIDMNIIDEDIVPNNVSVPEIDENAIIEDGITNTVEDVLDIEVPAVDMPSVDAPQIDVPETEMPTLDMHNQDVLDIPEMDNLDNSDIIEDAVSDETSDIVDDAVEIIIDEGDAPQSVMDGIAP